MKTRIWQAWVLVMFLAAQVAFAQVQVVVKTEAGLVAGSGGGIQVWKGIPYAQPLTGDLRWKAPLPPVTWQGIRPALDFGPMCPQGNPAQLKPDMSEDCLNLNIWSGAQPGEKLPVFVWIHGGGFGGGSGRINGEPLARLGIVVVSINYRLGMLGFLAHPDLTLESPHHASGNYGLMDQIAALHWVQNNIAAFGGDPYRITIGGSSAGGTSIGYLMGSPLAKGLFQGAWLDSASRLFLPDPGLSKTLRGLTPMEQVGLQIAPHIQELRALSTADVMMRAAQVTDELYGEGGSGRIGLKPESRVHMPTVHDHPWWAFTDGYVMPAELYTMFASGHFNHVACLIGTCKDEGLNFTRKMPDLTFVGVAPLDPQTAAVPRNRGPDASSSLPGPENHRLVSPTVGAVGRAAPRLAKLCNSPSFSPQRRSDLKMKGLFSASQRLGGQDTNPQQFLAPCTTIFRPLPGRAVREPPLQRARKLAIPR